MTSSQLSDTDPLGPILALPGVAEAADRARKSLEEVHRHKTNRRGWPATATEASVRGARASAAIDGGSLELPADGDIQDPILAGALRVSAALDGDALPAIVEVWRRAPMQVLARLHVLAAAGLVEDPDTLGRPRVDPGVGERLDALSQLVTGGTSVPAPVLAAVAHGELASLKPFGQADGVIARAVSRLISTATGLDPHNLGVPEVYLLKRRKAYVAALDGFAAGGPEGVANWVITCCGALETGAQEALGIAEAHAAQ